MAVLSSYTYITKELCDGTKMLRVLASDVDMELIEFS